MQMDQLNEPLRPLLTTKLHLPQARRDLVPRPRLFERLHQGLSSKLTVVSAPAGFGKTMLVSAWIAMRNAHQALPPAAWVALDAGDNDPVRFWRYVITACQTFDAAIGRSALALLHGAQQPSWETVLTTFINELAQLPGKGVLVLEDYHVITAPQIHEMVLFLLDHLPTTLHLIMTTRSDPQLPLARLRAQADLNELRAADLRFSLTETQAFFQQVLSRPLAAEMLERLEARTEGWVTGLRLVAITLQGRLASDPQTMEQLLVTLTGSRGHIFAYFITEVLNAQPASHQEFLLRTSVLSRLTSSLCHAVTDMDDSESILEQLERANLFLMPLDGTGQWYRYHALFAEALHHEARRRLGEERLRALSHRASLWYAQHGWLTEAVEAALAAQDFPRAADLVERSIAPELVQNEYHTLRRWLELLPEAVLHAHPSLCFILATAILFTSERRTPATMVLLQTPLQVAEQYWRAEDNAPKLGEALALRSWITWMQGERTQALTVARQALELLPASEMQWRGVSLALVGEEELLTGRLHAARQTFTQTRALWQATRNAYGVLATTLALGEVYARQGELQQAAQLYQQVLTEAEQASMNRHQALSRMGAAHLGLGALALEWNDLEAAEQHATHAVTIGQQVAYEELRVRGSLILARLKHVRGETAEAQQLLHTLIAQTPQQRGLSVLREVRAYQARLALASGDLVTAERFIASTQQGDDVARLQQEQEALLVARLRIAQGKPEEAIRLLEPWRDEAHVQGRAHSELEIMVLRSLAHFVQQDLPQATETLHQALAHAQAEGYQRLFLDEGEAMASLLRLVWQDVKEEPLVTCVRTLLHAFIHEQPAEAMRSRSNQAASLALESAFLLEPLSPQERRVLRLLAVDLSNAEIAKELGVSINTVKTQVQSIYRKLNVHSRQEARDAASHLHLR
jgi:LuxR family transcriptional regulator, maltose regulon positive regulatory protein